MVLASFTFLQIMHREILMDINDVDGDRAAGVLTLPVVFGACHHLIAALCILVLRDLKLLLPMESFAKASRLRFHQSRTVTAGRTPAFFVAVTCAAAASAVVIWRALRGDGLAWMVRAHLRAVELARLRSV